MANTDQGFCGDHVPECLDNEFDVDDWMEGTDDGMFEERGKTWEDDATAMQLQDDDKMRDDDHVDGTGVDGWAMVGKDGSCEGAGVDLDKMCDDGHVDVAEVDGWTLVGEEGRTLLGDLKEAVGNLTLTQKARKPILSKKAPVLCPVASKKPRHVREKSPRNMTPNNLYRRAITVGFNTDPEAKLKYHWDLKALVIGQKTRNLIKKQHLGGWVPKFETKMLVLKQTKTPTVSPISEAIEIVCCFAAEQEVPAMEVLNVLCIDLRYIQNQPKFQTQFKKAIPRVMEAGGKDPSDVITSIDVTVECLVAFVADCRAEAERNRSKGFKNPSSVNFVKVSTLNKYFNRKLELFYVGMIVIDYVFGFTNRCREESKDDGNDLLVEHLTKFVGDCRADVHIWRFYDGLLRIFQEPKPEHEQDESRRRELEEREEIKNTVRQKMLKYPHQAMQEVKDKNKSFHAEDYFCDLQEKITELYGHAKPESLHLNSTVRENDMLLVRWHTLQHIYRVKCLDDEAKTPLLFYQDKGKATRDQDISRHKERGWYDDANRLGYYGTAEKQRSEGMKKNLERESGRSAGKKPGAKNGTNSDSTPEVRAINRNGSVNLYKSTVIRTVPASVTKDVSSKPSPKKKSKKRKKNGSFSNTRSARKTTSTVAAGGGDTSENDSVDDRTSSPQDSPCVGRFRKRCVVVYTLIGTIDGNHMEGNSYVLNIQHGQEMNLHIESCPFQLVYTNLLADCHHGVCRRGMVRDNIIQTFDGNAHTWIPAPRSYLGYEYGVLRMEHQIMQNKSEEMHTIAWIEVINFLARSGEMDVARDGGGTTTFRYDFGYSNQDFSWREREHEGHFRDAPSLNKMGPFQTDGQINSLGEQVGRILDMMTSVLLEVHITKRYQIPLSNQFIYEVFTTQLNEKLGCSVNRFQAVTMGLTLFTPQEFLQFEEQEKAGTLTQSHTDDGNGQNKGNEHCCIFHMFVLLHDEQGKEMIARIFVIAYTRKSLEDFENNELLAMPVKKKLTDYKEHVNSFFEGDGKSMGSMVSITSLENMSLPPEEQFSSIKVTPVPRLGAPFECKYFTIPALHSPELSLSAAITIIRKFYLKSGKNVDKTLQLILVALFQSNWLKFFYAGEYLLEDPGFEWDGNYYAQFCEAMENKFQEIEKDKIGHRCRPPTSAAIAHYKTEHLLEAVVEHMKTCLTTLNTNNNMDLEAYREEIKKLSGEIMGIAEFRVQRITVLAACSGVILTNNVKYAKYGFPSETGGVSRKACDNFEKEYDQYYGDQLKNANLEYEKKFDKISRLCCFFIGYRDRYKHRTSWGEYLLCEAVGRENYIVDYLFLNQDLYYILDGIDGVPVVMVKEKGSLRYSPLDIS